MREPENVAEKYMRQQRGRSAILGGIAIVGIFFALPVGVLMWLRHPMGGVILAFGLVGLGFFALTEVVFPAAKASLLRLLERLRLWISPR